METIGRLVTFGALAGTFEIDGDVILEIGLPEIPPKVGVVRLRGEHRELGQEVTNPVATRTQASVVDFMPGTPVVSLAKRLLDDIFSAFGLEGCELLTAEGEFVGKWADDWARDWATA